MRGRDWFILGARLFGLWVLYMAISYLVSFADFRISDRPSPVGGANVNSYLVQALAHGAVALYLLFGTRHLAQLCYWDDESSPPDRTATVAEKEGKSSDI